MKTITVNKDHSFDIPKEHRLTKQNRKLIIKTEKTTSIEKVLKGDCQVQTQFWNLDKRRKSHIGLIEINGEFYKIADKTGRKDGEA